MQKEIIIIVAYLANNRGIGFQGKLPWQTIEADMTQFKARTMGHSVIMGKNTLASLNGQLLSGRQNIIVSATLNQEDLPNGAFLARTLEEAIGMATGEKIFLIGGVGIYKEAMEKNIANTIIATIIHEDLECDRFFPVISNNWQTVYQGTKGIDPQSELSIQFATFKNKKNPFLLGT